jgi:hypothetical protein
MFFGHWSDFVHDNHVREGDICIFQPVKNAGTEFTMKVHLIRKSKVDMLDENRNCPGEESSSRGRMRTKVLSVKTHRRATTGNTRSREASETAGGPGPSVNGPAIWCTPWLRIARRAT